MVIRKSVYIILFLLVSNVFCLWAGDVANFVDLGFSPDGKVYMFGQYGVQAKTLKPWADLYAVDVSQNNFVPGGRISYVHNTPVTFGQDGAGAFSQLISRNTTLMDKYRINFLLQGKPLFVSSGSDNYPDPIEFRDFDQGVSYRASLVSTVEGTGANLKSSFHINVERTSRSGSWTTYVAGSPQIKRPLVSAYCIRNVIISPRSDSLIFIVEEKVQGDNGIDIRYMIEALSL